MMRTRTVKASLLLGLLCPALAFGQTEEIQREVDEKLAEQRQAADQVLADVLKNNPDIRVAEAKLAEAQAELERTRLNVLAQAATLQAEIRASRRKLDSFKSQMEQRQKLVERGLSGADELLDLEASQLQAEADLESLQQQLQALRGEVKGAGMLFRVRPAIEGAHLRLGFQGCPVAHAGLDMTGVNCTECHANPHDAAGRAGLDFLMRSQDPVEPEPGSMTDRILRALDKPITVSIEDDGTLTQLETVLMFLREQTGGDIPIRYIAPEGGAPEGGHPQPELEMLGGELPLGAWLMYLQDSHPDLKVVIRPYGILVSSVPPANAMFLSDVWPRRKDPGDPPPEEEK